MKDNILTEAYHWSTEHCQNLAKAYIEAIYPIHRQLNILRVGNQAEIAAMGQFIDACREWSKGEQANPAALEKIKP